MQESAADAGCHAFAGPVQRQYSAVSTAKACELPGTCPQVCLYLSRACNPRIMVVAPSATHDESPDMSTSHRKRVRSYNIPGHAHELTFSCFRRLPLLSRDRTRRWFVDAMENARRELDPALWAYVI